MNRNLRSKIIGTGMCVPDQVITNDDLAQRMDTTDEWIQQRTGIKERRWIVDGETPADLAQSACEQALQSAQLDVGDIDFILLATLSPQHEFPGTSFFLHDQLGAGEIPCIDLRALGSEVDTGDFSGAELVVKKERCAGKFVLGREGGEEDEVDVPDI